MFYVIFFILLVLTVVFLVIHSIYILGFEKRYCGPGAELFYPCEALSGEEKKIPSFDGCRLKADFFKSGVESGYLVILLHGYRCRGSDMMPVARMYTDDFGFDVLVPDLRAHGDSGGSCISFGRVDGYDVAEWVKYAENMLGKRCRVILHGVSMGGAAALFAAACNMERVCCVISDCSYCSAYSIVSREITKQLHLPSEPLVKITDRVVRKKGGFSVYDCSPEKIVHRIKCPVLIIHGGADDYIPPSDAYRLASLIRSYCSLYICDGAVHAGSALKNPDEYKRRIKSFLSHI